MTFESFGQGVFRCKLAQQFVKDKFPKWMETPEKWSTGLSSPGDGPDPGKEQQWAGKQ